MPTTLMLLVTASIRRLCIDTQLSWWINYIVRLTTNWLFDFYLLSFHLSCCRCIYCLCAATNVGLLISIIDWIFSLVSVNFLNSLLNPGNIDHRLLIRVRRGSIAWISDLLIMILFCLLELFLSCRNYLCSLILFIFINLLLFLLIWYSSHVLLQDSLVKRDFS